MNNECDMAGLWVVKSKRWMIHKVSMSDSLPQVYIWDDTTVMTKTVLTNTKTHCVPILKKFIHTCCKVSAIEMVNERETTDALCKDAQELREKIRRKDCNGHQLISFEDEQLEFSSLLDHIKGAHSENQRLLLLLPASVCLRQKLTSRRAIQSLLERVISGSFHFSCITSANVSEKPVSLVLVHVKGRYCLHCHC